MERSRWKVPVYLGEFSSVQIDFGNRSRQGRCQFISLGATKVEMPKEKTKGILLNIENTLTIAILLGDPSRLLCLGHFHYSSQLPNNPSVFKTLNFEPPLS